MVKYRGILKITYKKMTVVKPIDSIDVCKSLLLYYTPLIGSAESRNTDE